MRAFFRRNRIHAGRVGILLMTLLLLGGCYQKRFQWSPDGKWLAVITNDGLYLSDAEGRLSPLLLPAVEVAAWLSDSERLAVSTSGGRLAIARIENDTLAVGPLLYWGRTAVDIRVAPGDQHLAFTIDNVNDQLSEFPLYVVPSDGSAEPTLVSHHAAAFPDWNPDGTALAYLEASGGPEGEDRPRLGSLVSRAVVDGGQVELATEPNYLAAVVFSSLSRVRCLRDGRILFSAFEMDFPLITDDASSHEQLFSVDPGRQPTLLRLIPRKRRDELPMQQLYFFEVSPDEHRVLFGTSEGDVQILTLSTGSVLRIQSDSHESMEGAPIWRSPGEITYLKRLQEDREHRPAEVVSWNGNEETVLSADWGDEFMVSLPDYKAPREGDASKTGESRRFNWFSPSSEETERSEKGE